MAKKFVAAQSYHINASPTAVFRALTDPKQLVRWFLSRAEVEERKGGTFSFEWLGGYEMESRLVEFTRNRSVAFRWLDTGPGDSTLETRAAFRVSRQGKGTLLRLRHSGFRTPEHYVACASRWAYYLMNLKSVLEHGTDLRSEQDW